MMRKPLFALSVLLILSVFVLAACGGGGNTPEGQGGTEGGQGQTLDRPAPPAEFASMTNPHGSDQAAIDAGATIYQTNCASCHGPEGEGDGPAAAALPDPKPQNLKENEEGLTDAYMFWRISEGGQMEPFNSAMPAWKGVLNEDQIWQVISYIHSLD